jgi:hypothetical protein
MHIKEHDGLYYIRLRWLLGKPQSITEVRNAILQNFAEIEADEQLEHCFWHNEAQAFLDIEMFEDDGELYYIFPAITKDSALSILPI